MFPSLPQLLIVLLVVILIFGRGRIAAVMGDFGKGIKAFRQGVKDESDESKKLAHKEPEKSENTTSHSQEHEQHKS